MDSTARRKLIEKAIAILEEGDRLLAVQMDEFFDGNTDEGSIGVNLSDEKHIGLAGFRDVLKTIRDREDVQDVFIELTEIPDPDEEEDADLWPVGCVAFVITSAPLTQVTEWTAPLHPRDISEGWNIEQNVRAPLEADKIEIGMRPVRVWLL